MNKLAQTNKCSYSRFADDITFSTNSKNFPENIACIDENGILSPSPHLLKIIKKCSFEINPSKTRIYSNFDRQEVTGLTVNKKVNIEKNYYRYSKAMTHSYCSTGLFKKSTFHTKSQINTPDALHGILNHIFSIKKYNFEPTNNLKQFNELDSLEKMLVSFSFHKEFVHLSRPHIICEEITDPLHLKFAYKKIYKTNKYPFKFNSLEQISILNKILGLTNGTPILIKFLKMYKDIYKSQKTGNNICVIFLDGDNDGTSVITSAKKLFKGYKEISFTDFRNSGNLLYTCHLYKNLYIIQLPKDYVIENIYPSSTLNHLIGTRSYNGSNESFSKNEYYGKLEFIENIIKNPNFNIDFNNFNSIFDTLFHTQLYHYFSCHEMNN